MGQKVGQAAGKETVKDTYSQQTAVSEGQKLKPQSWEASLFNLQRTHGNRHVQQMFKGGVLQRKCVCGQSAVAGGECAECAKNKGGLQRKLAIGASNDPLEREADRVADRVMSASTPFSLSVVSPRIQRLAGQSVESTDTVPVSIERVLAQPGRPLDPSLQQDMEQRFGHDFSLVRIHTGAVAERSAWEVNANAYTMGNHIVFGASQFSPETNRGRRLIAHELVHVLQQLNSDGICNGENNGRQGIARLQRQVRKNENTGGCGICTSPAVTGTLAHTLAESIFKLFYGKRVILEPPFFNPNDEQNYRLDLMRIIKSPTPPTIIEIGEIKPDNDKGRTDGKRDLDFYKAVVQSIFPGPLFEVHFMELPAPALSIPFKDIPGSQCPFQEFRVRSTKLGGQSGLYLYSCTPPGRQINKSCCGQPQPVNVPVTSGADEKMKEGNAIPAPTTNPGLQPVTAKTFEQQILDFIHEVIVGGQDVEKAVRKFLNEHREIVNNIEVIIAAIAAGAILTDIISAGAATAKDPLVVAILSAMFRIARTMRAALPALAPL